MAELVELLKLAGYDNFKEARHPFGLSQRQANGNFTRDEASELIDKVTHGDNDVRVEVDHDDESSSPPLRSEPVENGLLRPGRLRPARPPAVPPSETLSPEAVALAFPDELLAEELTRRGWTCTPPSVLPE